MKFVRLLAAVISIALVPTAQCRIYPQCICNATRGRLFTDNSTMVMVSRSA
jgi:hypothetical protein